MCGCPHPLITQLQQALPCVLKGGGEVVPKLLLMAYLFVYTIWFLLSPWKLIHWESTWSHRWFTVFLL